MEETYRIILKSSKLETKRYHSESKIVYNVSEWGNTRVKSTSNIFLWWDNFLFLQVSLLEPQKSGWQPRSTHFAS